MGLLIKTFVQISWALDSCGHLLTTTGNRPSLAGSRVDSLDLGQLFAQSMTTTVLGQAETVEFAVFF